MQRGHIKFYNRNKNFGFVVGDDDQEYYFNSACLALPAENDQVVFQAETNPRGNMAKQLTIQRIRNRRWKPLIFGVIGIVIGLAVGFMLGHG